MIVKTRCLECQKVFDLTFDINTDKIPEEGMSTPEEWKDSIFKTLVFNNPNDIFILYCGSLEEAYEAKIKLEKEILGKIMKYERKYGQKIVKIETNLTTQQQREIDACEYTFSIRLCADSLAFLD